MTTTQASKADKGEVKPSFDIDPIHAKGTDGDIGDKGTNPKKPDEVKFRDKGKIDAPKRGDTDGIGGTVA